MSPQQGHDLSFSSKTCFSLQTQNLNKKKVGSLKKIIYCKTFSYFSPKEPAATYQKSLTGGRNIGHYSILAQNDEIPEGPKFHFGPSGMFPVK